MLMIVDNSARTFNYALFSFWWKKKENILCSHTSQLTMALRSQLVPAIFYHEFGFFFCSSCVLVWYLFELICIPKGFVFRLLSHLKGVCVSLAEVFSLRISLTRFRISLLSFFGSFCVHLCGLTIFYQDHLLHFYSTLRSFLSLWSLIIITYFNYF